MRTLLGSMLALRFVGIRQVLVQSVLLQIEGLLKLLQVKVSAAEPVIVQRIFYLGGTLNLEL